MFELVQKAAPRGSLIADFHGGDSWLSNFSPSPLWREGVHYPSVEHAFQAGKTLDMNLRQQIANAATPRQAKRMGRSLTCRPNWDQLRHDVMRELVAAKFTIPALAQQLVATGNALLIEGNDHHDNEWGWCRCPNHAWRPGDNFLGQILMRQREELNPELKNRWTRVAATGHRPHKIPPKLRGWVRDKLAYVANKLTSEHGMEIGITGLAMGTDLWWAQAVRDAGTRLWGYSPFPEQDQRWSRVWRNHRTAVMADCERVEHLAPQFANAHLYGRNRWMIRDAHALVAVANTARRDGGTIAALNHALTRVPVVLIDLHDTTVRLVQPRSTVA